MSEMQERREGGHKRVPLQTLVEVCSNDPSVPAFEAESVDLSGRGMQVRTAYLPRTGDSLVCRLEDRGREILVEGVVAWRKEQARGGEFGIRFTALDAGSIEALRDVCGADEPAAGKHGDAEAAEQAAVTGSRVRLHIDGLGSPMKARVREAGSRQLHVGSNLEFLKVGKRLEIENMESQTRRVAKIDTVSVTVDPQTQVPQLVVGLRYEGEDNETTPEPSVIDAHVQEESPRPAPQRVSRHEPSAVDRQVRSAANTDDPDNEQDSVAAARLEHVAEGAAAFAKTTGAGLKRFSQVAAGSALKLFKDASSKVSDLRSQRNKPVRRTTSPARSTAPEPRRLRPQTSKAASAEEPEATSLTTRKWRKIGIGAGAAVVLMGAAALALQSPSDPPGAQVERESATAAAAAAAAKTDVKTVDEQGNPVAPAPLASGGGKQSVTADVPLFGPTAMATAEPAPLGALPEELQAPAANGNPANPNPAAKAAPPSADESWSEQGSDQSDEESEEPARVRPEDVKPWGRGKLKEPTVFRLRLDAPGAAIQGHPDPTGFTVLIPGRKLLESASSISKRDDRIARVRTESSGAGAEITFKFKDGVPGYRVRLRRDFVEFLVSAPEEKSTSKPSKTGADSKSAKKTSSRSDKRDRD